MLKKQYPYRMKMLFLPFCFRQERGRGNRVVLFERDITETEEDECVGARKFGSACMKVRDFYLLVRGAGLSLKISGVLGDCRLGGFDLQGPDRALEQPNLKMNP
ncbi:MAG: hypothetical protein LLH30_04455 [Candidatus Manganitrophus sp. SA1]|nr:hypothetical protein [Candidatus Manganitrophus morganii]